MKYFSALLLIISLQSFAQTNDTKYSDHLVPDSGVLFEMDFLVDYLTLIRENLLDTLKGEKLAQMVVTPSFNNEYVISLNLVGSEYFAYYVSTDEPISSGSHSKVYVMKKRVSKQLATSISKLMDTALSQIKVPNDNLVTFDGTSYHFSNSRLSGYKPNPRRGSKIDELTSVMNLLLQKMPETEFIIKINELLLRFESES